MFLIIGLGNPGLKYKKTRHNTGFQAVDFLVGKILGKKTKWIDDKKTNSKIIKDQNIIFAKPQTLMNNSGQAVQKLAAYYKIKPENIIIIYDELDLPFGEIRVRRTGSSAGHNGIKSIIQHLGTENFWRMRLGISNENKEKLLAEQFVLKKFSRTEQKELLKKIFPQVVGKINEIMAK